MGFRPIVLLVCCLNLSSGTPGNTRYSVVVGYLPNGSDLTKKKAVFTLSEAKEYCGHLHSCSGFTFAGPNIPANKLEKWPHPIQVIFKSHLTSVIKQKAGSVLKPVGPDNTWYSYVKKGVAPLNNNARSVNVLQHSYRHVFGYLPAGNELTHAPMEVTISTAQRFCSSSPHCQAFTFQASSALPKGSSYIHFKSSPVNLQLIKPHHNSSDWHTYMKSQTGV